VAKQVFHALDALQGRRLMLFQHSGHRPLDEPRAIPPHDRFPITQEKRC